MQTFIVEYDYDLSARRLDIKRLGKQRVECLQLLNGQFPNHPASKMWRGHEAELRRYMKAVCKTWELLGFKDSCWTQVVYLNLPETGKPKWMVDLVTFDKVIHSHRSNLIRKEPEYYGKFWPDVPNNVPYFWG